LHGRSRMTATVYSTTSVGTALRIRS
jgi:hypothetical protein